MLGSFGHHFLCHLVAGLLHLLLLLGRSYQERVFVFV